MWGNVIISLVIVALIYWRKNVTRGLGFLGEIANGFSAEYNSAYLEPEDEDEDAHSKSD